MLKKKIILMMVLSFLIVSTVSCGDKDIESSSVVSVQSESDNNDIDNNNDESHDDDNKNDDSSAPDNDESHDDDKNYESSEADVDSDKSYDENDKSDDDSSISDDVMTNKKMLRMINDAFGVYSDETFEDDLESAILWDILPEETELEPNDTVTPEFFITIVMRATGYVDQTASLDTVLECAVEYKVIETADISAVDLNNAQSIVEAAQFAWLFPNYYQ